MENQSNFIKTIMTQDLENKKHDNIITRFPPEPNGFLHIGHARAIVINFELAKYFGGKTNLRYDDTNPSKEDDIYVKSIKEDIKWLGYEPNDVFFASNYFQEMYDRAVLLINKGLAYVDSSTAEEIQNTRGTLTSPGEESKDRNRPIEENLKLFTEMKEGKHPEGAYTLRAKIDMTSPNMNMRDPVIYRISYDHHHNTKDKWCIYPMYDYAHPLEDAMEGITHSLCSLEFEDHRPLYDWVVRETEMPLIPRQIEFGRLNIENTVMSKRYLRQLVEENYVNGWDDPRLPTLQGLRRRGYTPASIRAFILSAGLSKINATIQRDMLEAALRDDLLDKAKRVMAVIDPIKVTITNYADNEVEYLDAQYLPGINLESRKIAFSKHIYIDKEDFLEVKPNKHYKRLALGLEVRLFNAYFIKANEVVYNEDGSIKEILATYDVNTKSGTNFNERKPNGTIQFVSASHAIPTQFNFYEDLIIETEENKDLNIIEKFNNNSHIIKHGFVEEALKDAHTEDKFQFLRHGFFSVDKDSTSDLLVVNEIVPLKSSRPKGSK